MYTCCAVRADRVYGERTTEEECCGESVAIIVVEIIL